MFTRNYYRVLLGMMAGRSREVRLYNLDGKWATAMGTYALSSFYGSGDATLRASPRITGVFSLGSTLNTSNGGLVVGSGRRAPSLDDYALETRITSGLQIRNTGLCWVEEEGVVGAVSTFAIRNAGESTITVAEVGLVGVATIGNATGSASIPWLAERTVLTQPLVIEAGRQANLTYAVRIPFGEGRT